MLKPIKDNTSGLIYGCCGAWKRKWGEMMNYLYHYFERKSGPFMTLTALPIKKSREILYAKRDAGSFANPDIEGFLQKRYARDKQLRDAFIARGGLPQRMTPVYMMLGEHRQWESAYNEPVVIRIPLEAFDPKTISFTYGDSFAILNPMLFNKEDYWNKVYFADEILKVIAHYGLPPYVEYDFKRSIYPTDKSIDHHLKYVEAHVWSDHILNQYRNKWLADNPLK